MIALERSAQGVGAAAAVLLAVGIAALWSLAPEAPQAPSSDAAPAAGLPAREALRGPEALLPAAAPIASKGPEAWAATDRPVVVARRYREAKAHGLHFVDAPDVRECREHAVIIATTAAEVPNLPKPTPNPAVMESHGVDDSESPLREKLHRAWDLISGKT